MFKVLPLITNSSELSSSTTAFIADNTYLFSKELIETREPSCNYKVEVYALNNEIKNNETVFSVDREILISGTQFKYSIPEQLFSKTYEHIKSLPEEYFEIRPTDHFITIENNFVDPWGEPTTLMESLEKYLSVVRPPLNNCKVFSNREDHFTLDGLHVDSFEGMRTNSQGRRLKIWRYFLNLAYEDRGACVCLHHPQMVDYYLGRDYRIDHMGKFLEACNFNVPAILLNLKGRTSTHIYGFKILATHLLHAPYNKKDDFIAIINTL